MDITDILYAKKLSSGGGGGGGGSSDFSTAEVTVILNATSGGSLSLPNVLRVYDDIPDIQPLDSVNTNNGVFTVILYQNKSYIDDSDEVIINTSGNIEFDSDLNIYIITGDCSITVKTFSFS